jgi:hypothetical protein
MSTQRPNHALQRTRPSRSGCNPRVSRAGSLSLGRWTCSPLNTLVNPMRIVSGVILSLVEEFDVETVLNFALETIRDASQFWIHGSLEQKRRFQQVIFPEGLVFDGKEFGTATTCLAFSYLQGISKLDQVWRPVRESNPCRRRERAVS